MSAPPKPSPAADETLPSRTASESCPVDSVARPLSGWGRFPVVPAIERRSEKLTQATAGSVLCRGLGRSYGDSSLPPVAGQQVACSVLADRLLSFDETTGVLRAEAGLSLLELNRLFLPRGWFTPVTPGTQFVTLGGMVAADVHGKNHHVAGCFGQHVRRLKLQVADGRVLECSPDAECELFWATVGGMGLTGHLLEVEFVMDRIPSPWIQQESERIPNLEAFVEGLGQAAADWPFTVGWIDCLSRGKHLGRGLLIKGRWATADEAPDRPPRPKRDVTFPVNLPSGCLNRFTVRLFNFLYYWKHLPQRRRGTVDPRSFFYPLDAIRHWNRLYGKKGFIQYQCVLPKPDAPRRMRELLELLAKLGGASFLSVIKDCGAEGQGMLSFPKPGLSLALDIPFREKRAQQLVDAMNALVLDAGGRVYLAKDALTRRQDFQAMEPRLDAWNAARRRWDPQGKLRSAQSVRLLGDEM
ncbi:MAG: FAD-binding oxidoreductase [Planctomycetales bacterium]